MMKTEACCGWVPAGGAQPCWSDGLGWPFQTVDSPDLGWPLQSMDSPSLTPPVPLNQLGWRVTHFEVRLVSGETGSSLLQDPGLGDFTSGVPWPKL